MFNETLETEILKVVLPSHRPAKILEMTLNDINMLQKGEVSVDNDTLFDVLQRLVILNPDEDVPSKFIVDKSPLADLVTGIVQMRRVTHGDDVFYNRKCPECKVQWRPHVDLSDEQFIPKQIKYAKDGDLSTGVDPKTLHFIVNLPRPFQGIDKLRCRLFFGADQARLILIKRKFPNTKMTEQAKLRIVGFEGQYHPDDKDKPEEDRRLITPTEEWLKAFPVRLWNVIDEYVQDFDGGIQTSYTLECPNCGAELEEELPIGDKHFFSPRSAKK